MLEKRLLVNLRPCEGYDTHVNSCFKDLTVFHDFKTRSRQHMRAPDILDPGLYYVEWPFKARLDTTSDQPRLLYLTRWLNWHPKWDTWEPHSHFFEGATPENVSNYAFYTHRLDILTCRFLIAYAFLGAVEELAASKANNRDCAPLLRVSQPWVNRLIENVKQFAPHLTPRLMELLQPLNWLGAPLIDRLAVRAQLTQRSSTTFVLPPSRLLQKILFSVVDGLFTPGECSEEIVWYDQWKTAARNAVKTYRRYALVPKMAKPITPEVRLPRRRKTFEPRDPLVLWLWRTHAGSTSLAPFPLRQSSSSYVSDTTDQAIVSGMKLTMTGLYCAPLVIDNPSDLETLWVPPWISNPRYLAMAKYARAILPPFSTPLAKVPKAIQDELDVVISDPTTQSSKSTVKERIYLLSFKKTYGHTVPAQCWVNSQIVQCLYPHLLIDWSIEQSLKSLRGSIVVEVTLTVPRIMTLYHPGQTETPLVRLRHFLASQAQKHFTNLVIETLSDHTGDYDIVYDHPNPHLTRARWDLMRLKGPAREVIEAVQLIFDFTETVAVDEPRTEDPDRAMRVAVFAHIPKQYRQLYEEGEVGLLAFLLICGYHPPKDRPQLNFLFPEFPRDPTNPEPTLMKEHERLFDSKSPDFESGLSWPLFVYDSPKHVGRLLACLYGDIATRLLRRRQQDALFVEALYHSIPPNYMQQATSGYGPFDIPPPTIPPPDVMSTFIAAEKHLWRLGKTLEDRAAWELDQLSRPATPLATRDEWLRDFDVAFRASMIAFGAPGPLWTSVYPQPHATVDSLGLLAFKDVADDPPWIVTHKDTFGGVLEVDEEMLAEEEEDEDYYDQENDPEPAKKVQKRACVGPSEVQLIRNCREALRITRKVHSQNTEQRLQVHWDAPLVQNL